MTFTYTVGTNLGNVRMALGDTVSGTGVLPSGANFTDEEINEIVDVEGTWQKAVAHLCEILANRWATSVNFSADGVSVSRSDVARTWREMAAVWRANYGGTHRAGSASVTRSDGFSTSVANVD